MHRVHRVLCILFLVYILAAGQVRREPAGQEEAVPSLARAKTGFDVPAHSGKDAEQSRAHAAAKEKQKNQRKVAALAASAASEAKMSNSNNTHHITSDVFIPNNNTSVGGGGGLSKQEKREMKGGCRELQMKHSKSVPIFWLNLDKSIHRRRRFTKQMNHLGFKHQRVRAVTPDLVKDVKFEIVPRVMQTPTELACTASHLLAIHAAVHDKSLDPQSPYALILEDDVMVEMDVDFAAMADTAPKDFGILQMMTSASHDTQVGWKAFNTTGDKWTLRTWESGAWSTQAYLINKANVKAFIDKVVVSSEPWSEKSKQMPQLKFITPSQKMFPCKQGTEPCGVPFRIVADIYLYTGCGPTYISNIPVFNGAIVNSTIHIRPNTVRDHHKNFQAIGEVIKEVRGSNKLPPFVKNLPLQCQLDKKIPLHETHGRV